MYIDSKLSVSAFGLILNYKMNSFIFNNNQKNNCAEIIMFQENLFQIALSVSHVNLLDEDFQYFTVKDILQVTYKK